MNLIRKYRVCIKKEFEKLEETKDFDEQIVALDDEPILSQEKNGCTWTVYGELTMNDESATTNESIISQ